MLIDTHCHLDFPEFDTDRDDVIERARKSGIACMVNIGSSLEGSEKSVALAKKYDCIYATVGLHPHEADSYNDGIGKRLKELSAEKKVVAIGETGLDFFKNYSQRDNQEKLFQTMLGLAKDLELPLVIHSREAQEDIIKILKRYLPLRAVVHCFSGDEHFLNECLALGFYVSFTCNITYPVKLSNIGRDPAGGSKLIQRDKKAQNLRELVKMTPLDRLMLETDAPFLSPEGFRGRRNEPLQVRLLAEEISRVKGAVIEEVARQTTENAKQFFNLAC